MPKREHGESVHGVVIDDLVADEAPVHDRRQREKAENQGADGDVAHQPPLAEQQGGDKSEAEGLLLVGQIVGAAHQHHLPGPNFLETHPIDEKLGALGGVGIEQCHAELLAARRS